MNVDKYIEIFAQEAEEHLQLMRQGFMSMEKEGVSPEQVHELLRSAHTIKGSALMVNLNQLGELAHEMEEILKSVESGEKELTPELVDLMLVATDAVEALVAQAHSGGEIGVNVDSIMESLKAGKLIRGVDEKKVSAGEKAYSGSERRKTIRASVQRLDLLVNQLSELLITKQTFEEQVYQINRLNRRLEGFMGTMRRAQNYESVKNILDDYVKLSITLERSSFNLGYQADELHSSAMQLRMLPLSTITEDLGRLTRDLAREQEKEIDLFVEGESVELDRMMLEAIKPMLLHMLRNSIDHGIESPFERASKGKNKRGLIRLTARYEGAYVQILLVDDGQGIHPDKVRKAAVEKGLLPESEARAMSDEEAVYLILKPGFSTREFITDVSGRGVGMDVVKTNIDRVKGNLIIHSTPGQGTEIYLQFPLTMAIISGLLVKCADEKYAIPLHYVTEILRLNDADIMHELGREVIRVHGETIPLFSLIDLLGIRQEETEAENRRITAVVLNFRERKLACLISETFGEQELVVKTMGGQLKSVELFSGATILGDGSPALILSIPDLFTISLESGKTNLKDGLAESRAIKKKGRVLVVDDSITTRTMEKNILETHGYEVTVAVSGSDALAKLEAATFDLMVSDVEMPGMTGFELTRKVRQMENTKNMPVIICTSLSSDQDKRLGMEVGAQAYIIKGSFDQGTLLETVETLIA